MELTTEFWLSLAYEFLLGKSKKYYYNNTPSLGVDVILRKMEQMDGSIKWAIKLSQYCLGKDNSYYHESNPSSRTDEYLTMCRFDTKEQAYEAWVKNENTPKKGNNWIEAKYL